MRQLWLWPLSTRKASAREGAFSGTNYAVAQMRHLRHLMTTKQTSALRDAHSAPAASALERVRVSSAWSRGGGASKTISEETCCAHHSSVRAAPCAAERVECSWTWQPHQGVFAPTASAEPLSNAMASTQARPL